MKRISALLLAFLLLVTAVSCGKSGSGQEETSATTADQTTEAPAVTEPAEPGTAVSMT